MSFKETYTKYYPELIRYGHQLNVNRVDIDDVVQETFMRYHIELKKNTTFENTRAWLYKVMLNLVKTRNNTRSLHASKIRHYRVAEVGQNTNEIIEIKERRKLVFQVLQKIPEKERNLLILYHHGLKYKEIAEALEMNPNSVGTFLVRAINKVKEILNRENYEVFG